jgi:site-specific recombinase XerC
LAGSEDLTAANVAAYHAQLVAGGLASSTVKKERAAINSYVGVGDRCGQPVLATVMKRLGATAGTPVELRHAHALRHTCANELLRSGATIADVQRLLGHASIKTTSIYLSSDGQRQEDVITHRDRERLTIDEDLDAAA